MHCANLWGRPQHWRMKGGHASPQIVNSEHWNIEIKLLESYYKFARKINFVHNTENLFLFPSACHQYILNENYGAVAIFQYQFTSTVYWTSSVLLNSRNWRPPCKNQIMKHVCFLTIMHITKLQQTIATSQHKGKASSLDIAPLTVLDSGALQPRKWQLTGIDCSTAAQAVAVQSPR